MIFAPVFALWERSFFIAPVGKAIVGAGTEGLLYDRALTRVLNTGSSTSLRATSTAVPFVCNIQRGFLLGRQASFIIPHCDPSVNLYDRIHCVRGEVVEAVWRHMERASGSSYF